MLSKLDKDKYALELCKKIQILDDKRYQELEIEDGFDLNHYSKQTKGWLPIHFAAHLGKENIVKLLIDNGANPYLGCHSIDKNGYKETWANCFFKIKKVDLRENVRNHYINLINKHNMDNFLVALPEIVIIRIALLLLLEKETCFNSLLRTTKYFSDIIKPYILDIKKIHDNKTQIQCNNEKMDYNPMYDMCLSDAVARATQAYLDEGGRENKIRELNRPLEEEIESLCETISRKMRL